MGVLRAYGHPLILPRQGEVAPKATEGEGGGVRDDDTAVLPLHPPPGGGGLFRYRLNVDTPQVSEPMQKGPTLWPGLSLPTRGRRQ